MVSHRLRTPAAGPLGPGVALTLAEPLLRRVGRIASTQDLVHELAEAGAPVGTAVVAAEQTGGRGSRGRTWASPPGGLWLSTLCRPPDETAARVLSLRVGLAVAEVLEGEVPCIEVRLKWPNDLMVEDRKLGGILCEARWQGAALSWVVVGLGLNVSNPLPAEVEDRATSIEALGCGVSPEALAEPLRAAVAEAGTRGGPLTSGELARYVARDWLAGRTLREPAPGTAVGIAGDGALLVRSAAGNLLTIRSGTVQLL